MPWHIGHREDCPASKPFAVIKDADGSLEACHPTREKARQHMAALYANEGKAVLTSTARENLPDSAFACREQRKYPHHHADGSIDLPHLRNALSRVAQAATSDCGVSHLRRHARIEGIGEFAD